MEADPRPIRVILAAMEKLEERGTLRDAATELAALHGAELRFLYAIAPTGFGGTAADGLVQRGVLDHASPRLDAFVEHAHQRGVRAGWITRFEALEAAVGTEAKEQGADLAIVVPPRRWLVGRWLRRLRKSAGVPVLCVPAGRRADVDLTGSPRIAVPVSRREGARSRGEALRRSFLGRLLQRLRRPLLAS